MYEGVPEDIAAVASVFDSFEGTIDQLCTSYDEAYNAALKSFQGQFDLFEKVQASTDATVANAQAALNSQLSYWDSYNASLETLTAYGGGLTGEARTNFNSLMAYISSGSEEAVGLALSMNEEIQNGNSEVVSQMASTLGEVKAKQSEAAAAVTDWQTGLTESLSSVEQAMQDAITKLNLSADAEASARETISAYVAQISSGAGEAAAAAEDVKQQIESALSGETTIEASVKLNTEEIDSFNMQDQTAEAKFTLDSSEVDNFTMQDQTAEAKFMLDSSEVDNFTMQDQTAEAKFMLESSEVDNYMPEDKEAKAIYTVDSSRVDSWTPPPKTATLTYKIVTSGSVPSGKVEADANGTTNAASIFIAGEEGPELIARPAAAYATGTTDSNDYFIAGENGPELIVGQPGITVFPTSETDRLIQTLNGMDNEAGGYSGFASKNTVNNYQIAGSEYDMDTDSLSQVMLVGMSQLLVNVLGQRLPALPNTGDAGNKGASEKSLHITLDVTGQGSFETQANNLNEDSIVEIIADNIRPMMIKALKQELFEEGDTFRDF